MSAVPADALSAPYPAATLAIDYPDRQLDRLSTALRLLWAIPVIVLVATLGNGSVPIAGYVALPTLLMLVFRGRYPGWWFAWNLAMSRFAMRVCAYLCLMDDRYPSTEDEQSVHLALIDPGREPDLSRGLPLVKWLLAVPHYLALFVLSIGAVFAVLAAWVAILITGRYPRPLFAYVEGVLRWQLRVSAYAFLLITDDYPPFRLAP
ncbi:MAG: DUF4389 domain-containing protein [Solirubrobacteraceae bacterium]|nr:DUF4389 domain-containing protein [Solirubrobacteraceae bacterium]